MFGDEDLALCMDEATVPVVIGGTTLRAYFDQPGADVFDGTGVSNDYAITVRTTTLPAVSAGTTIQVDGVAYKTRETWPIDDGALTRITLRKA
jgi:hypothetical protein